MKRSVFREIAVVRHPLDARLCDRGPEQHLGIGNDARDALHLLARSRQVGKGAVTELAICVGEDEPALLTTLRVPRDLPSR